MIFDSSFMIYQHLTEAFARYNVHPNILYKSQSWDFLYYSAKFNDDLITILPLATDTLHQDQKLVCRRIKDPVLWKVMLCIVKKNSYTQVENYIFDQVFSLFNNN